MDAQTTVGKDSSHPPLTSTNAAGSPRCNPSREWSRPDHAKPFFNKLASDVQRRAGKAEGKKHKVEAESRPNSSASGPIDQPGKRRKQDQSQLDESILNKTMEELKTDSEKAEWYRAAIRKQGFQVDVDINELELPELIEMYNNPQVMEENWHADDEEMEVQDDDDGPANANDGTGGPSGAAISQGHQLTPLSHVDSTDHMTILGGVKPNDKHGWDKDGKRLPLSPSGEVIVRQPMSKGKRKGRIPNSPAPNDAGIHQACGAQQRPKDSDPPAHLQSTTALEESDPAPDNHPRNDPSHAEPRHTALTRDNPSGKNTSHDQGSRDNVTRTSAVKAPSTRNQSNSAKNKSSHNKRTQSKSSSALREHSRSSKPTATQPSHEHQQTTHEDEEDNGDSDEDSNSNVKTDTMGNHKRKESQLDQFGEAIPVVKAVRDALKIRFLKKNPYADVTLRYSEAGANESRVVLGYVIDTWLSEEWGMANAKLRPGKAALEMEEEHISWLTRQFSRWHFTIRSSVTPYISDTYGLNRSKTPEENKETLDRLKNDGILSPTLTPNDPNAFRNKIFQKGIHGSYFSLTEKSLGYWRPKLFRPIPRCLLALVAMIMFIGIIHNIEKKNKQLFTNYQMELFDQCHGLGYIHEAPLIEVPAREYGPDMTEVYVSKVVMYDNGSDNELAVDEDWEMFAADQEEPPVKVEEPVAGPSGVCQASTVPRNATPGPSNTRPSSSPPPPTELTKDSTCQPSANWPVEELVFTDPSSD
ncbi:hypothetical protein FRC11_012103 [Ceratobasidium sp. 423]|nr:hypothetical protein FRC11_012103 [Ceratobasidium sp. 423]